MYFQLSPLYVVTKIWKRLRLILQQHNGRFQFVHRYVSPMKLQNGFLLNLVLHIYTKGVGEKLI